jgi:hypothetical protein
VRRTNCVTGSGIARACLLLFLALLSVPGLAGLPLMAFGRCGLLAPHEHVLLGGADESDLRQHLIAEAACRLGAHEPVSGGLPRAAARKEVLSVTRGETHLVTIGQGQPRLAVTAIAAPRCSNQVIAWQMRRPPDKACSPSVSPLTPPPRAA